MKEVFLFVIGYICKKFHHKTFFDSVDNIPCRYSCLSWQMSKSDECRDEDQCSLEKTCQHLVDTGTS